MNYRQAQRLKAFFWLGLILFIGIVIRAKSFDQILAVGGATLWSLILLWYSVDYFKKRLVGWAIIWAILPVFFAISIGSFFITREYVTPFQVNQQTATATASVQTTATNEATATSQNPTPTQSAPVVALPTPPQIGTNVTLNQLITIGIPSTVLSNLALVKIGTDDLNNWAIGLGLALIVEFILMFYIIVRTEQSNSLLRVISIIVGIGLSFTKIGEWFYQVMSGVLGLSIFGWGGFGRICLILLALMLGGLGEGVYLSIISARSVPGLIKMPTIVLVTALAGLSGIGSITAYFIGVYVIHDIDILTAFVLPSILVSMIELIYYFPLALHRRALPRAYLNPYIK